MSPFKSRYATAAAIGSQSISIIGRNVTCEIIGANVLWVSFRRQVSSLQLLPTDAGSRPHGIVSAILLCSHASQRAFASHAYGHYKFVYISLWFAHALIQRRDKACSCQP